MSLAGWDASQKIVLKISAAEIGSNLTDFPLLVNLSSSSGKNGYDCADVFSKLGSNSKKIAIENGDTGNQCYVEIELWDNANSKAVLHVKVPSVYAASDTILNLYYDETQADNATYVGNTGDTAAQNVWDSGFAAVYHMAQDPSGSAPQILDSTANANHGTENGSMTSGDLIAGNVGRGIDFDGADDWIDCGTDTSLDVGDGPFTAEVQFETDTSGAWQALVAKRSSNETALFSHRVSSGDVQSFYTKNTGGTGESTDETETIATATQYTIVAVRDDSQQILYRDGQQKTIETYGNSGTVTDTSAGLVIGRKADDTSADYFDGRLYEVRLSSVARSADWIAATNKTLQDNLLRLSASIKILSLFVQPYSLPPYIVNNFYSQPYDLTDVVRNFFVQLYGLRMVALWTQQYGNAPVVRAVMDQYYGDAAKILQVFEQPYRSAYQVRSVNEQPYSLPAALVKIFEQRYSITADQVRAVYDQLYAVKGVDAVRRAWVQPWLIVDGGLAMRQYIVTATVGGQEISIVHADIETGRDQYAMSCELQLAGQADYLACRIMSELVVAIDGETFRFFVESKFRNRRHGQVTYTIHGLSPAAKLDAPYAEPWTGDLTGMASAIADQVAGGLITIDWQTVDWFIPADTLLAGDATPIQIIRQLAEAAGAILQSQPDGSLTIEPLYPTQVPDWDSVTPDYTLSDALDFFSTNEDFDHRPGYNLYSISDQAESLDTVRIEEETVSATEKIIRVYQTPWQDDFYLDNTGGAWVIIEPLGIEQKEIEDELVEFVGGEGHSQYPIYGASAMSWLQEPLGTVTVAEDGRLTASVGGESLLRISYHTKCRKYRAIDHQVEPVQIVARVVA